MERIKKKKKIWIVNYYSSPPEFVSNPRHLKFAYYLIKAGYDVTIISSSYLHKSGINLISDRKKYVKLKYNGLYFIHIKTKCYKGNGLARMFSIFQFAYRLFRYRKKFEKPEVILHNIHIPFDVFIRTCAKKLNAKYIAEAWDLWPDAFVRFGLIRKTNPFIKVAYKIEKRIYKKADRIIFSMEGGKDYIISKAWDKAQGGPVDLNKVHYINNGIDMDEFESNKHLYKIEDTDLENRKYFKVIYLGSIRKVNNLIQLINAAKLLKNYRDIIFLIYGDGNERRLLLKYCKKNSIDNVIFKQKWIALKYVPYVLSHGSLSILNYNDNFGKYGISSSKFFQYLASGRPIICNVNMKYDIITNHKIGIAKKFNSDQEYADAILTIKNMKTVNYLSMCENSLKLAMQFDYKILSQQLLNVINGLINVK